MELTALILSIMALIISMITSIFYLSRHFSTHVIQRELIDPFKDSMSSEIGKTLMKDFRDFDEPIGQDELESMELKKPRK